MEYFLEGFTLALSIDTLIQRRVLFCLDSYYSTTSFKLSVQLRHSLIVCKFQIPTFICLVRDLTSMK